MLNRTNLTLSALALSNRLNLGTRSLAAKASVNFGDKAQNIRQSHHGVMRGGMCWSNAYPIPAIGAAFPPIPSSFSPVPQRPSDDVVVQCSWRVADVQGLVEPRLDNLADRPERTVSDRDPGLTTTTTCERVRTQPTLLLDSQLRSRLSLSRIRGLKRDARATAPRLAAARQATPGK